MRLISAVVLTLVGVVFVPHAHAANPSWATGYPKPGATDGTIAVKGDLNIGAELETTGSAKIIAWLVGGGIQHVTGFTVPAGQTGGVAWGEAATGNDLTSNFEYWVVVQIEVKIKASGITYSLSGDPAKSRAK